MWLWRRARFSGRFSPRAQQLCAVGASLMNERFLQAAIASYSMLDRFGGAQLLLPGKFRACAPGQGDSPVRQRHSLPARLVQRRNGARSRRQRPLPLRADGCFDLELFEGCHRHGNLIRCEGIEQMLCSIKRVDRQGTHLPGESVLPARVAIGAAAIETGIIGIRAAVALVPSAARNGRRGQYPAGAPMPFFGTPMLPRHVSVARSVPSAV